MTEQSSDSAFAASSFANRIGADDMDHWRPRFAKGTGWALAACLIAAVTWTPLNANAEGLASRTLDACSGLRTYGPQTVAQFQALGWSPVNRETSEQTLIVLADGMIIASAEVGQPTDWAKQVGMAEELTQLLSVARPNAYTVFSGRAEGKEAALVVFGQAAQQGTAIHCNYSGPPDDEIASLVDVIGEMDKRAGSTPADPAFDLVTIAKTEAAGASLSLQIARYTAVPVKLGRVPLVEIGFSAIVSIPN